MAVPVLGGFPIFMVVRVLGFIIAALVLIWTVHYRGGLALSSDNKDHIFNVILSIVVLTHM
jgi:cytochrome b-561